MKELSIEEKAKRYESALERCRKLYNEAKANEYTSDIEDYETIFPELKESEDEKIRRAIYIYLDWLEGRKDYAPKGKYSIRDMMAWIEKQGEQKPNPCNGCINRKGCINCENGELKETEQKPAWSEEDEDILNTIINHFKVDIGCTDEDDMVRWLKSLKDRYTWKPSDKQMEALKEACDEHWEPDGLDPLYKLWKQLKKLREE